MRRQVTVGMAAMAVALVKAPNGDGATMDDTSAAFENHPLAA